MDDGEEGHGEIPARTDKFVHRQGVLELIIQGRRTARKGNEARKHSVGALQEEVVR